MHKESRKSQPFLQLAIVKGSPCKQVFLTIAEPVFLYYQFSCTPSESDIWKESTEKCKAECIISSDLIFKGEAIGQVAFHTQQSKREMANAINQIDEYKVVHEFRSTEILYNRWEHVMILIEDIEHHTSMHRAKIPSSAKVFQTIPRTIDSSGCLQFSF